MAEINERRNKKTNKIFHKLLAMDDEEMDRYEKDLGRRERAFFTARCEDTPGMNELAVCITGDSKYPDDVYIGDSEAYVHFTGQTTKQDDHFVLEAIRRGLPIHLFYRRVAGVEFIYLGVSTDVTVCDFGAGEGPMRIYATTKYKEPISCGRAGVEYALKHGCMRTIGKMDSILHGYTMQRCFIPLA